MISSIAAVLGWVLDPAILLPGTLLIGVALLWSDWARAGRWLASAAGLVLLVIACLPISGWMIAVLEDRFPAPPPPRHVDGVIVLGGSVTPGVSEARGMPTVNDNADRLIAFARLARLYPDARLVFTGGGKPAQRGLATEAELSGRILDGLGVPAGRVTYEDRSTSTYENAVFTRDLVHPGADETWLLVTSAWHMPRAVASFDAAGWPVVPYPVGYTTSGGLGWSIGFEPVRHLAELRRALHEWGGLIVYRLRGQTHTLFPAAE